MMEICKFKRQKKLRIVTQQIAHLIEINTWHSMTVTPKYLIIFLVHNDTKTSLYERVHVDVM